ncbi:MAG: thymidine kinase [Candidatus Aenigmarchaeota archaeon]|nr:thymidine kinase [Candidatus Aenigmarchaeota archaeon]
MRDYSHYMEVISGPMFSGKTTELLRQYEIFKKCIFPIQVFRWVEDGRYGDGVKTHAGHSFNKDDIFLAKTSEDIRTLLKPDTKVVMVDEGQFFDSGLPSLLEELSNRGVIVIATVLPTDYRGEPFGISPQLLARADHVVSLNARCMYPENGKLCLRPATKSSRIVNIPGQVLVGGSEYYEPRCRQHHTK